MLRPLILFVITLSFALGGVAVAQADREVRPRGPGHVFSTIEAAAIDGLAFAHLQERSASGARVSRGGTVYVVEGGYGYRQLRKARADGGSEAGGPVDQATTGHKDETDTRSRSRRTRTRTRTRRANWQKEAQASCRHRCTNLSKGGE